MKSFVIELTLYVSSRSIERTLIFFLFVVVLKLLKKAWRVDLATLVLQEFLRSCHDHLEIQSAVIRIIKL